jgi:hypothetical protein
LVGCDDKYKPTNEYWSDGAFIIRDGQPGFEFNSYSFFIRLQKDVVPETNQLVFIISGLSHNSEPDVILFLDQAKLIIGNTVMTPIEATPVQVAGTVNSLNGENYFDSYQIAFSYLRKLHWGELINTDQIRNDVSSIPGFVVSIPAQIPVYDYRPSYESIKSPLSPKIHNLIFAYNRKEKPGEQFIKIGSW